MYSLNTPSASVTLHWWEVRYSVGGGERYNICLFPGIDKSPNVGINI